MELPPRVNAPAVEAKVIPLMVRPLILLFGVNRARPSKIKESFETGANPPAQLAFRLQLELRLLPPFQVLVEAIEVAGATYAAMSAAMVVERTEQRDGGSIGYSGS